MALLAIAELVINRLAVPALRPTLHAGQASIAAPTWLTALDYTGLFLFYFMSTLAVLLAGQAAIRGFIALRDRTADAPSIVSRALRGLASVVTAAVFGLSIASIVSKIGPNTSFLLEASFAAALLLIVLSVLANGRRADLGVMIGIVLFAAPFMVHFYGIIGARWLWPDSSLDLAAPRIASTGILLLCIAAIGSPYALSPRPFAYSVTRVIPVLVAMAVAIAGLLLLRSDYPRVVRLSALAIGVQLDPNHADPRLAVYLLATATLVWTLTSCVIAPTLERRRIGLGVLLIVLAGFGLAWPGQLALVVVGFVTIADQAMAVKIAEQASVIALPATPAIDDRVWTSYIGAAVAALRDHGHNAQALTVRGGEHEPAELMRTVIAGDVAQHNFQLRINRLAGRVAEINLRFGQEVSGATQTPEMILARHFANRSVAATKLLKSDIVGFSDRVATLDERGTLQAMIDEVNRDGIVRFASSYVVVLDDLQVRKVIFPCPSSWIAFPIPLDELALQGVSTNVTAGLVAMIEAIGALASRTLAEKADAAPQSTEATEPVA